MKKLLYKMRVRYTRKHGFKFPSPSIYFSEEKMYAPEDWEIYFMSNSFYPYRIIKPDRIIDCMDTEQLINEIYYANLAAQEKEVI